MKNLKSDFDDSLRPEYKRSDFGTLTSGAHATTQVDFQQLASALMACIGEDEDIKFIHHSIGNTKADHKRGDWTYEIDNSNQIILRYWLNEFGSVEETIDNPAVVTVPTDRAELQNELTKGVKNLKIRVEAQLQQS